jgi:hypothetical protein
VREWKDALQWCAAHLPRQRALVKLFLERIQPRKLAQALEIDGCRKIESCIKKFIMKYKKGVVAKKDLSHLEDAPRKPKPTEPVSTPGRGEPKSATPRTDSKPVTGKLSLLATGSLASSVSTAGKWDTSSRIVLVRKRVSRRPLKQSP